jgi:hypothetical protein
LISGRTKTLFWIGIFLPLVPAIVGLWQDFSVPLQSRGDTYFVVIHMHALRLLLISGIMLTAGLISLLFDRRNSKRKC